MPQSFYNQATARLSVDGAKVFCNCNPESPYHWFYTDVLSKLKEQNGLYIHFTMDDNLTLSDEIKERYKRMYSGVFADRFISGKWVVANGLIYDMFKQKHELEPEDIPYDDIVKWCVGVDYGTGNATVFLLVGKTVDGTMYVCKEYYFAGRQEAQAQNDFEAQKTDLEFAEDMKQFITENYNYTGKVYRSGPNGMTIVVDPAAASFILQLRRMRMKVSRADNVVLDGIRTVATHIGDDRLFISKECVNTIKEMHTYMWDDKAQLKGIDAPIKKNDHCVDALRYAVMKLKDKTKVSGAAKHIGI